MTSHEKHSAIVHHLRCLDPDISVETALCVARERHMLKKDGSLTKRGRILARLVAATSAHEDDTRSQH